MNLSFTRLPKVAQLVGSALPCQHRSQCVYRQIQQLLLSSYSADRNNEQVDRDTSQHAANSTVSIKTVGLTKKDQKQITKLNPDQPDSPRSLKVAVIGAPNAGKSTLVNKLLGWKVSAVSKKVHTTRKRTLGVLTENNTQIVFLDTPGMITPEKKYRHRLEMSLLTDPHSTLIDADLIAVMVDAANFYTCNSLDPEVLKALHLHSDKKSVLILNKVDLVKMKFKLLNTTRLLTENRVAGQSHSETIRRNRHKKALLEILKIKDKLENNDTFRVAEQTDTDSWKASANSVHSPTSDDSANQKLFTSLENSALWEEYYKRMKEISREVENKHGWGNFDRVFMISALSGDGVKDLKKFLLDTAGQQQWLYHSSLVTDQDPMEMARNCVHEKLLDNLPREVPYQITVNITLWEIDDTGTLRIMMNLVTSKNKYKGILMGRKGEMIQKIALDAKQELMNTFKCDLSLNLAIK